MPTLFTCYYKGETCILIINSPIELIEDVLAKAQTIINFESLILIKRVIRKFYENNC